MTRPLLFALSVILLTAAGIVAWAVRVTVDDVDRWIRRTERLLEGDA